MEKIKLEQRTCKCGCGKTFKVMPSSLSCYFSFFHVLTAYEKGGESRLDAEKYLKSIGKQFSDHTRLTYHRPLTHEGRVNKLSRFTPTSEDG
jgi:hypothetical protein